MSGDEDARVTILRSIRDSLRKSASVAHAPRAHGETSGERAPPETLPETLDGGALVERFRQRLNEVGGTSAIARDISHAAALVQEYLSSAGARTVACSDCAVVRELCAGLDLPRLLHEPATPDLLACDAGLCSAQWGVAESGSLILESRAEHHRRVSLLPPVHVALLSIARIVPTLAAALSKLHTPGHPPSRAITFVTGPSRTADIELALVIGVHGPRQLHVVLLESA